MTKLNAGRKCPYCGKENKCRIHRKSWMRLFSFSKLFECKDCRSNFLCIGVITIGTYSGLYNLLKFQEKIG